MPKKKPDHPILRGIYLAHFFPSYKHAGHYLGYSTDIFARFNVHLSGQGVPLIRAAVAAGCQIVIARIWLNATYQDEAHLKQHHKKWSILCPICNPTQHQFLFQPENYTYAQPHLTTTTPATRL